MIGWFHRKMTRPILHDGSAGFEISPQSHPCCDKCLQPAVVTATLFMPRTTFGPDYERVNLCNDHLKNYERLAERPGYTLSASPIEVQAA